MSESSRDQPHESPRIYVASLSDYNAGRLHGVWIDASADVDDVVTEIQAMLRLSRDAHAEEYAIHDYEGFQTLRISEYDPISQVVEIAHGIVQHGRAFAAWASVLGAERWDLLDQFDACFRGHYECAASFAEEMLAELGIDTDELGPAWLSPYLHVDLEGLAQALLVDYEVAQEEGIYLFEIPH